MNHDALLKLLDLNGMTLKSVEPIPLFPPADRPSPGMGGPTAFHVDAWGLRRGCDLLAESERLQRLGLDAFAIADFHTAAFDPDPQLLPACQDAKRHRFLTHLLQTPDYHALHADTRLDETAATIATVAIAEAFAREDQVHAGDDLAEMATLRAVGKAIAEATEGVEALRETASAFGMGPGAPGSNDPTSIAALFRRVRHDPQLKRICELAGRYRRVAQSKQRRKCLHGMDDIVGVAPGGDIGRLLPTELVKLTIPELELDTLRRIAERQAACRVYAGTKPIAKGPIVVCVDESGSMSGEPLHTAKALALAMAWIARQQRRWCGLVAYSGDSGERLLRLPPARWDEAQLADWLTAFLGRGSSLDVPVRELPRMVAELKAPVGDTDVVFITDAQCHIPANVTAAFLQWKTATHARLVTLVIRSEPGDLVRISDEVHRVPTLAVTESAVERLLSI